MAETDDFRYEGGQFLLSGEREKSKVDAEADLPPPRNYNRLAIWLALATIVSTFWAGVSAWVPLVPLSKSFEMSTLLPIRQLLLANWSEGLQFSLALMAILLAHELGHYLLTIYYRVPSTPPLFIPFPFISPIGTMGAVIMMQSGTADRKQIFDIGLAGPLAGLVVAVPVIIWGVMSNAPVTYPPEDSLLLGQPLLIQWLAEWLRPELSGDFIQLSNGKVNPLLMAGWVGLLVTGLNMVPLGQLDGGHVAFGLLGPKSYWVAMTALALAIGYMVYSQILIFSLMLFLVLLMGIRHPPSSNDDRQIGFARQVIGWASLTLPLLCIPANPIDTIF